MAEFVLLEGEIEGRRIPVTASEMILGRSASPPLQDDLTLPLLRRPQEPTLNA